MVSKFANLFLALSASVAVGQDTPIEVVVAHYNEDLGWLSKLAREEPSARDAHFTIYAKGLEELDVRSFSDAHVHVKHLPNVGRESHTYLSHIVKNYDNLAKWTVFTQAGEPSFGYKGHSKGGGHLLAGDSFANYLQPQPSGSRFVYSSAVHLPSMNHALRGTFCINDASLEPSLPACPAHPGLWSDWLDIGLFSDFIMSKVSRQKGLQPIDYYRKYINPQHNASEVIVPFAQGSRFAVSKEKILSRPKETYEQLLETLSHNEDPYSGYFMEWLWSELFLGSPAGCALPHRRGAGSHADAMNDLMLRYQKGLDGHRPSAHLVRHLASPAVSGISGNSGISGISGSDSSVTSTVLPTRTPSSGTGSPGTSTTVGSVTTAASSGTKSFQVTGSVTITVANCTAFTSEAKAEDAVEEGLKEKFLTADAESQGVTLSASLSCATTRRLSGRGLAAGDLMANYVIDIPATASVDAASIQSSIKNTNVAELTTAVQTAVNANGLNAYSLTVAAISTPTIKVISDQPSRESTSARSILTAGSIALQLGSILMMAGQL